MTPRNPEVGAVSAFFPCYNDALAIPKMVRDVHGALVDERRRLRDHRRRRRLERRLGRRADGAAGRDPASCASSSTSTTGATAARCCRASPRRQREWVFYTDGDAQYDASELIRCIDAARPDVDIVQGYKLGRGDRVVPQGRSGAAYHHVVRLLFGLRVRDTDCDFRLIRRRLLDRGRADVDVGRDLRRDDAQVPGRRRPLRRGRRQPLRPPARPLAVLPPPGDRPLGPPAAALWWTLVVCDRRLTSTPHAVASAPCRSEIRP